MNKKVIDNTNHCASSSVVLKEDSINQKDQHQRQGQQQAGTYLNRQRSTTEQTAVVSPCSSFGLEPTIITTASRDCTEDTNRNNSLISLTSSRSTAYETAATSSYQTPIIDHELSVTLTSSQESASSSRNSSHKKAIELQTKQDYYETINRQSDTMLMETTHKDPYSILQNRKMSPSSTTSQNDNTTEALIALVETESSSPSHYGSISNSKSYDHHSQSTTNRTGTIQSIFHKGHDINNTNNNTVSGGDDYKDAMDALVEKAATPQFRTEVSDTIIDDPNTPPLEVKSFDQYSSDGDDDDDDDINAFSTPYSSRYGFRNNGNGGRVDDGNNKNNNNNYTNIHEELTGMEIRDLERIGSNESSSGFELFPSTKDLLKKKEDQQQKKVSPYHIKESGKKLSQKMKKSFKKLHSKSTIDDTHHYQQQQKSPAALPSDKRGGGGGHLSNDDLYAFHEDSVENNSSAGGSSITFGKNLVEDIEEERNRDNSDSLSTNSNIPNSIASANGNDDDDNASGSTKKPRKAKSMKSKARKERRARKRRLTNQLPPKNTVPVKCINKPKEASDFNPLLLISSFTKSHDGPIWCTSFSKDGQYFATAGKDGVLQIWDVAPSNENTLGINFGCKTEEDVNTIWRGEYVSSAEFKKNASNHTQSNSEDGCHTNHAFGTRPPTTINSTTPALGTEIKILSTEPIQRFTDHSKDIVDISWSHTNFLLSASLDKTVRLWHHSKSICLKVFRHADLVSSVSFHPNDDRYFLSGGFDKRIRVWSITDGRVAQWARTPTYITAAAFQPDGKFIAAGLVDGRLIFYSLDGLKLKYYTQMKCKNRKSRKGGKKITGLSFLQNLSDDKFDVETTNTNKDRKKKTANNRKNTKRGTHLRSASQIFKTFTSKGGSKKKAKVKPQVLVTTNDSRLRLIGLDDFCMVRKYKGVTNTRMQIKAKISESGAFIICGSETGTCSVWNTATKRNPLHVNVTSMNIYDKVNSYERFEATVVDPPIVTDTTFVPSKSTKRALMSSGLFPTIHDLDHVEHDMSSAAIVTTDYEGTIRIFIRRECIDTVAHASGPAAFGL